MAIQQLSMKEIDEVSGGCCLFSFFSNCFSNFFKSCRPAPTKGCGRPTPPTPPVPPIVTPT